MKTEATKVADAWIASESLKNFKRNMPGDLPLYAYVTANSTGGFNTPLYAETNPALKALVDALKECADDLEAELTARYPAAVLAYPGERKKYERDMQPVISARDALTLWIGKEGE